MQKISLTLRKDGKDYKTYTSDIDELSIGLIKRICTAIDIDKIIKDSKDDQQFFTLLTSAVVGAYPIFEEYLLKIFPELTEEELDEYGTPSEVGTTIASLLQYTAFRMSNVGKGLKNLLREGATT